MSTRKPANNRRRKLAPAHKLCLSCRNGEVTTDRGQLRIFCQREHLQADSQCPDYSDAGTSRLLAAIAAQIRQAQSGYRGRFHILQPDCNQCVQNCCTTPFLDRTPFYPEDEIYYLLCDQIPPNIPKGLRHCIFFHNGCTLPNEFRPHVCVEYKCIYQNDIEIGNLAAVLHRATIDLLAVATGDFAGWRGDYNTENRASLKRRNFPPGIFFDRFDRPWDPEHPTKDLAELYGVND